MLVLEVEPWEVFDESKNEFRRFDGGFLELEHSLLSLSSWESKWNKPFITKEQKSSAESSDYVRCMIISQTHPKLYLGITAKQEEEIVNYISSPMTAFTLKKNVGPASRDRITSETIYYCMIAYQIPFECQNWHLNRLIALIDYCSMRNNPQKKMGRQELLQRNSALNAERRKLLNSKG